jgi:hypothetical protein
MGYESFLTKEQIFTSTSSTYRTTLLYIIKTGSDFYLVFRIHKYFFHFWIRGSIILSELFIQILEAS